MSQSSKRCSRKIKTSNSPGSSIIFRLLRRFTGSVNDTFTFYSLVRKESIDMFLVLGLACWCPQHKPHSIVKD